jgi:putative PIN family toxin of toxin-antitoxin system
LSKVIPKIVIDTNLLIAAFFNKKSASFKILKMAEEGKVKVLWSDIIKKEGEKILKNIRAPQKFKNFLTEKIFRKENRITKVPRINIVKEDVEDNKFLACAQKGKANLIISNDRHLLEIKKFRGIPILRPTQAIKKLKL